MTRRGGALALVVTATLLTVGCTSGPRDREPPATTPCTGRQEVTDLPTPVVAWSPIDHCQVAVVDPSGTVTLVSERQRTVFATGIDALVPDVTGLVATTGRVWLAGDGPDGHATLVVLDRDRTSEIALPRAVGTVVDLTAYGDGILLAGGTDRQGTLLAVGAAGTTHEVARFDHPLSRVTTAGSSVLVAGVRGRTDLMSGRPAGASRWREHPIEGDVHVVDLVITPAVMIAAVSRLEAGVPVASSIVRSTDRGRTWSDDPVEGRTDVTSAAGTADGTFIAAMASADGPPEVVSSRDANAWTPVDGIERSEISPQIRTTGETAWILTDRLTAIPLG
ncbi:hypothetical protein ACFJIY_22140 [Pimelobacter simplex]|uniref:hypothetical protein n=1 Tax=Nocardioides simplex TaxID=2045 RepID=UPI00366F69A6